MPGRAKGPDQITGRRKYPSANARPPGPQADRGWKPGTEGDPDVAREQRSDSCWPRGGFNYEPARWPLRGMNIDPVISPRERKTLPTGDGDLNI